MAEIVLSSADHGKTIMELLKDQGYQYYAPCGGKGTCGKCKIKTVGKVSRLQPEELEFLTVEELSQGFRLACRTFADGQVTVHLPDREYDNSVKGRLGKQQRYSAMSILRQHKVTLEPPSQEDGYTIIDTIQKALGPVKFKINTIRDIANYVDYTKEAIFTLFDDEVLDFDYNEAEHIYGVAVDIGTTTVACYLMNLTYGAQIEVASRQNPQFVLGADVISRIQHTLENENGLSELREKIIAGVNDLIDEVSRKANINKRYIYQCVLVGNTAMAHLFWGLNCNSLARLPFNAVTREMLTDNAESVGLTNMNANGKVIFLPGIGGFVGADTIGGMLATRLVERSDNAILLDLGTNGEIVLSAPQGRFACSTAAGPAFEGARIKHGMQAFSGAIKSVKITDDLTYTTIEGQKAIGICGSGLIDLVSELLEAGLINGNGKIADPAEVANKKLAGRIVKKGRNKEIVITDDIVITQKDIRELQVAKGAVAAGIHILLKIAGLSVADIDNLFLAGAFGNYINKESAKRIGLLPDIDLNKVVSIGNAAGEGAKMALCDRETLHKAKYYSDSTHHIELSIHPDFQEEFIKGIYLGRKEEHGETQSADM